MSSKASLWVRVKKFIRPERESYDTRRARGGDPDQPLATQYYESTDRRRHGGSSEIGPG